MRSLLPALVLSLVIAGCSSTGEVSGDSDAGSDTTSDSAVAVDAADDTATAPDTDKPTDGGKDSTPPTDIGTDSPKADAPSDSSGSIDALCAGVATASFQPPSVCDAASGNTSTEIPKNGIYSTSWFGCYRKADGTIYKDPSDNCLFACGSKGLCAAGLSGPECEATLEWFAADADRYGCGNRIRVTNCVNRRQVVLATLDRGPNCKTVEKPIGAPVLDMGHSPMVYLFEGKTYGGSEKKRVVVEAVAATTPLGPVK